MNWYTKIICHLGQFKYKNLPNNLDKYKLICNEICSKIGEKMILDNNGIYNGKNIYININDGYEDYINALLYINNEN
jgi:hypothetical protein